MKKNIFLIGYMGSGKSTLLKGFAKEYEYSFIDLDNYIEIKENNKIVTIFKNHGEKYFRELESKYLIELNKLSNTIIATGGGTPCHNNNMALLNKLGNTIYLKTSIETLTKRLFENKNSRPLIANFTTEDELGIFIKKTLSQREEFYNQCHYIYESDSPNVKTLMSIIKSF